ncbi:MAG: phosphate--acyl-ACP acyltransferase, partial [Syntrophomonadaceae bacterium]|nr:phosphate--acyl-ACP acyltransferase [Syntrophomonadaceae bacterium]
MILALDVMGGDYAPTQLVLGAVDWVARSDDRILLVGQQEVIAQELKKSGYQGERIEIVHASQVAEMNESPTTVVRRKKDASMMVATRLVQEGKADAVLSCGSTGAQMVAAIFVLGRMEGIERPPVLATLPNHKGKHSVLIDVGANVDCRPEQLLQFALLGQIYADSVLNQPDPVVMLLNNGSEEGKGN